MSKTETKTKIIASAIGRRKRAVASVRLIAGNGEIEINGIQSGQYFPGEQSRIKLQRPFAVTGMDKYAVTAKAMGGGLGGQLDAVVLGIARSLSQIKQEFKTALRGAGLLTRDARKRQRRMVGTGGKARRQKQSPKR
ncbi:30S ribosomal protein S9 [Candidatus Amesbacteria bacterium RIFOXYB1_FULL_44_23]|uniref:30S ribosomal protein S9 n=1 Tax=Candidatus Amesbacteria bacterium RIFOXYB1_FULL_44_23 TaxID=1797263 RepID=A0A1F4ZWM1_9BACT|nr:MAG: 30S ribosomal protein S9 [Candidatus Amesbacteria bacterium RIFOXYB1_FULL_44_23]